MRRLTVWTLHLFLIVSFLPAEDEDEQPPRLIVSARGEVKAAPDQALIQLGVVRRAETARLAQQELNEGINQIVAALLEQGVNREDVQTSELSLHPFFDHSDGRVDREPRIVGYEAGYTLALLVRDLDKSGPLLDVALERGANRFSGIQFLLEDEDTARLEALERAVENATQKARVLADAAGVELVRMLELEESSYQARPQPIQMRAAMMEQAADSSTSVLPGTLSMSATVRIIYEVRSR